MRTISDTPTTNTDDAKGKILDYEYALTRELEKILEDKFLRALPSTDRFLSQGHFLQNTWHTPALPTSMEYLLTKEVIPDLAKRGERQMASGVLAVILLHHQKVPASSGSMTLHEFLTASPHRRSILKERLNVGPMWIDPGVDALFRLYEAIPARKTKDMARETFGESGVREGERQGLFDSRQGDSPFNMRDPEPTTILH